MKPVEERIKFLSKTLAFYKKKGCRDILIDLRLATDCLALDRRLNRIVECLGAKVPRSLNTHYEEIERELIDKVAKPSGLSGENWTGPSFKITATCWYDCSAHSLHNEVYSTYYCA